MKNRKRYESFLVNLYSKENLNGKSPFDIPKSTMLKSFFIAILVTAVVGNIFLGSLVEINRSNIGDINSEEIKKSNALFVDLIQQSNDSLKSRALVAYLLPHLLKDWAPLSGKENLDSINNNSLIDFSEKINGHFGRNKAVIDHELVAILMPEDKNYLRKKNGQDIKYVKDNAAIKKFISGHLGREWYTLGLFPDFELHPTEKLLNQAGIYRDIDKKPKMDSNYWRRYLIIGAIQKIRDHQSSKITKPGRLLQALGGSIQWLTFFLATWCLILLLALRQKWCKLQFKFIDYDEDRTWNITSKKSEFVEIQKSDKTKNIFLVPRLIHETIESAFNDPKLNIRELIKDRVNSYRESVEMGEYEVINFLVWAAPTLGFIGTIFGIISAMENASAIFEATGPIEQTGALDLVSTSLGTAFDTSFVALITLVPMTYILARTKKMEADFFERLEYHALLKLPYQLRNMGNVIKSDEEKES